MNRLILLLYCMMAIALSLSSCQEPSASTEQTLPDATSPSEKPTDVPAPSILLVRADGTANCTVTKPTDCSEALTDAIEEFIQTVETKTGVILPVADEHSAVTTPYEIAVNATANRPFVAEQFQKTGYTDYVISVRDRHIALTFRSDIAAKAGLQRICNALNENDDGYLIKEEDLDLRSCVVLGNEKTPLPLFDTKSGETLPFYSVNGGYEICVRGTDRDEVAAYLEKLSKNGFSKYTENAIGEHSTYVFVARDVTAFLYYNAPQDTLRIVCEHAGALPSTQKPICTDRDTTSVSIAQIGIGGLGMSYVIQLKDARFIVVDGGTGERENAKQLYDYLLEKTPSGTKPTIACWFFTHGDPDHIGAPKTFLSDYIGHVVLESVAYNFPDCSVQSTSQNDKKMGESIQALENDIKRYYGATVYHVHTGQKLYFKGCEAEILLTEEDIYPRMPANYNDTSLVMRFTFDNGKTFLMLGDSTTKNSKLLAETFGEYLKSDILQLAHHGLIGGDKQLYQYVDPEICFWATSKDRFEGNYDTNKDGEVTSADVQHCLGEGGCDYNAFIRDDSIRRRTHYHGSTTVVVMIDELA